MRHRNFALLGALVIGLALFGGTVARLEAEKEHETPPGWVPNTDPFDGNGPGTCMPYLCNVNGFACCQM